MNLSCPRFCCAALILACCFITNTDHAAYAADAKTEAIARESPWPLAVSSGATQLTLYQPQLDAWDGVHLTARMAVKATTSTNGAVRTTYGIVVVEGTTLTDKGTRVVTIDQATISANNFSGASSVQSQAWGRAVGRALNGKHRTIALDRLQQQLAIVEVQKREERMPLRNVAPDFIFSGTPALSVYVDGPAVYRAMTGLPYERILNTRVLLLRDGRGTHYLKIFDGWMSAPALAGPWQALDAASADLDEAFRQMSAAHLVDALSGQSSADQPGPSLGRFVPAVYVVTKPTELIVTDGAPRYKPIAGTALSYMENTTGHVFRDSADGRTYILVSGRWFRATVEMGPWEFVAANALPADFSRIPDDSPVENVKASVAGTAQAAEAVVAATIPQTAAVSIAGTGMSPPQFDGIPVFEPIQETSLEYAANTSTPIVRANGSTVYAVQNGVWFQAPSVSGPWVVATSVPAAIYTIPPSSRLYYLTYVKVYAVSGNIVYVGYTPGYQGAYIDPVSGVVVYGSGYAYDPWVGSYWYGDPVTYGYAASIAYTPWTGWAYGFGYGWYWGAATIAYGWGWGAYPYWGPWAYPAWGQAAGPGGGELAWGPRGWAGYSGSIYQQWGNRASVSRAYGGFDAWTGNEWAGQVGGSYNSRTGVASAGQRGAVGNVYSGNYAAGASGVATGPGGNVVVGARGTAGNANSGAQVHGNAGAYYDKSSGQWTSFGGATGQNGGHVAHVGNDVYAGKDGNVYRNTGDGWQQHTSSGWQPASGNAQGHPVHDAGASGQHMEGLERERTARTAGAQQASRVRQSSLGIHQRMHGGGFHRR